MTVLHKKIYYLYIPCAILKREIILCWACDLSGECKRCIHNHGGDIAWEIEELKNNIKMDLREVSC